MLHSAASEWLNYIIMSQQALQAQMPKDASVDKKSPRIRAFLVYNGVIGIGGRLWDG
jgi:hypothetical protein